MATALRAAEYAVSAGRAYFGENPGAVLRLPVPEAPDAALSGLPPRLAEVALPEWAKDIGVAGALLVPEGAVLSGDGPPWARTDWFSAARWYLCGTAEREFERRHGPVHSYRTRLRGFDERMFSRAWVNRILLFLRRWAAKIAEGDEVWLFGPLPRPRIVLTHDVDAVRKTPAIRAKQGVMNAVNTLRAVIARDPARGREAAGRLYRFLFSRDDWWCFERIRELEKQAGARSVFMVHGGGKTSLENPRRFLMDPSYDPAELAATLRGFIAQGFEVGLHPSFDAWDDPSALAREKAAVEAAAGAPVGMVRQHWLRFSWEKTWHAQERAGLSRDMTLGWNEAPGFRCGAALEFHPLDPETGAPMSISALPLLFMDSQFYDYAPMTAKERERAMAHWIGEVAAVSGTASVIWHQQAFSRDYGWEEGYRALLRMLPA